MLFSSFKNLVSFFRQSNRGLTKSNTSNQFCKPIIGLCALLCMSLWISAAQAQQMRTALAGEGLIPASYTDSNSNPSTVTAENNVSGGILEANTYDDPDTAGPMVGLVDWVEVQIRVVANLDSAPTVRPSNLVNLYIKGAWLLSDGSVVDVDSDIVAINAAITAGTTPDSTLTIPTGDGGLTFDSDTQKLYVLINHRNHLPIMSPSVSGSGGVYSHDFTMTEALFATSKRLNNRYVMYAGDPEASGSIDDDDVNIVNLRETDPVPGQFGQRGQYLVGDIDFSTVVDDDDVNIVNLRETDPVPGNFGTRITAITY